MDNIQKTCPDYEGGVPVDRVHLHNSSLLTWRNFHDFHSFCITHPVNFRLKWPAPNPLSNNKISAWSKQMQVPSPADAPYLPVYKPSYQIYADS